MDKFCGNCGNKLNLEQDICLKCGKILNKKNLQQNKDDEDKEGYCAFCGNKVNGNSDFCLNCGKKVERNIAFDPSTQVNEKPKDLISNIGIFILLLAGYLILPQIVGSMVYERLNLSSNLSMLIGNMSFVIILIFL